MIRIGLIGCGDIATRQHLPALARNSSVELAAVCDMNAEVAAGIAAKFGAAYSATDRRRLFDDPTIDAVIVATPPWATPQIVIEALQAGKDVLSEKPMALSLEEAEEVAEAERVSDRLVQLGFTYRHGPLMDALRDWIAADRLGSPLLIRMGVFDETWAPEADPEHYERLMAALRHGGPCIHDGAHSADHLHFLTGSTAARITAFGARSRPEFPDDNFNCAFIEFANGDSARLEIGWFYPNLPGGEFEILGPKGTAYFDRPNRQSVLQCGDSVERVQLEGDWVESCFDVQLEKFVRSIETRSRPVPGTREGTASLRLTKAFERSIKTGQSLALD